MKTKINGKKIAIVVAVVLIATIIMAIQWFLSANANVILQPL